MARLILIGFRGNFHTGVSMNDMIRYLEPLGWVLGAAVVGFILEVILIGRLKKLARKTAGKLDDILVHSLRGMVVLWVVLLGTREALSELNLSDAYRVRLADMISIVIILSVTIVAMRITSRALALYMERYVSSGTSLIRIIANIVIFTIGVLIILQLMGLSITPILTTLGVGGLAVALALQDTLANLFAGVHILATRQIQPGDFIRLSGGEEGFVVDVGWRNSTVKTIQNNLVIIPNTQMASTIVENYRLPESEFSVFIPVGVSYSSDLEYVERVTNEVALDVMKTVEGGVPEYEPIIRYREFGDSSINFNVILKTKDALAQYRLRHEFIKRLHRRYEVEKITIPFPQRTVHMPKE